MKISLPINKKRVHQRRRIVMREALRAKKIPLSKLTKEAANFIAFGFKMSKIREGQLDE